MRSRVLFCFLSLAVWLVAVVLLWPAHGELLNWDEVDYVSAARLGVWANAFEKGSLSPAQFVRFALAKISGTDPVLPVGYDESRDPWVLRHYHSPLVVFLLSAVSLSRSERVIRSVQLLGALALICAILLSYRSLSGSAEWSWSGMLLVSLLALWMTPLLFRSVSFHGWEAVWATTATALLSRWLSVGERAVGLFLCVSLALALLTLETGLLVWVGAVLCLAIWRAPKSREEGAAFSWRPLAVGASLTVLFVLVVWPGSLVKVSLLKAPAAHLYRVWRGDDYVRVPAVLPEHLRVLLPMIVLGLLAALWLFFVHRSDLRRWGPFVVIGALYGIVMARVTLFPHHLLPALAPFVPLVGVASDRVSPRGRRTLVAVASLFVIVTAWPGWSADASDAGLREDIRWLGDVLRGREALVDGGHIYQYYLGPDYAIRPVTVSYQGNRLSIREGGRYRTVAREDVDGKVVVILKVRQPFFGGPVEKVLLGSCSRIDGLTIAVYDCAVKRASPRSARINTGTLSER